MGFWFNDHVRLGVKTKSIHEDEFSRICVSSFIIWCNPNWDATFSTEIPSKVLVSWLYQCLSFTLKSPKATKKSVKLLVVT